MAERVCRRDLRNSSLAGGISRLGRGAQRSLERCFLHADTDRLSALRAQTIAQELFACRVSIRIRTDVKTHAGDGAVRASAPRLLAARAIYSASTGDEQCEIASLVRSTIGPLETSRRKVPTSCAFSHVVGGNALDTKAGHQFDREHTAVGARLQRRGQLCDLHLGDDLASEAGALLSASFWYLVRSVTCLGDHGVIRRDLQRLGTPETKPISHYGLVLVSGNACAGNWVSPGWSTSAG